MLDGPVFGTHPFPCRFPFQQVVLNPSFSPFRPWFLIPFDRGSKGTVLSITFRHPRTYVDVMDAMECAVGKLLRGTGEVPEREGLRDTPKVRRKAQMQERKEAERTRNDETKRGRCPPASAAAKTTVRHDRARQGGRVERFHGERTFPSSRLSTAEQHLQDAKTMGDRSADVDAVSGVVQRVARALVFAGKGYEDTAKRYVAGRGPGIFPWRGTSIGTDALARHEGRETSEKGRRKARRVRTRMVD